MVTAGAELSASRTEDCVDFKSTSFSTSPCDRYVRRSVRVLLVLVGGASASVTARAAITFGNTAGMVDWDTRVTELKYVTRPSPAVRFSQAMSTNESSGSPEGTANTCGP